MIEEPPLVSVVIPAYNCERYLGRAIRSVLAQTYPRIECIVVDDGSTDGTAEVIDRFGSAVNAIRQENGGAAAARNAGILTATGRYIAFLDADDYWLRNKLELQIRILKNNPDLVLISTGLTWIGARVDPGHLDRDEPDFDPDKLVRYQGVEHLILDPYLGMPTVIVDGERAKAVGGFDTSLPVGEDVDFYFRVCADRPFAILRQELVRCQLRHGSLTTDLEGYAFSLEVLDRLEKAHPELVESHERTIRDRRLAIYREWVQGLILRGEGGKARAVLRRSRSCGRLPGYFNLYLKSTIAQVLRVAKRFRRRGPLQSGALRKVRS